MVGRGGGHLLGSIQIIQIVGFFVDTVGNRKRRGQVSGIMAHV